MLDYRIYYGGMGLVPNMSKYLGNFSAVGPEYSKHMECFECDVSWTGCWDNFMCPICHEGEIPKFNHTSLQSSIDELNKFLKKEHNHEF